MNKKCAFTLAEVLITLGIIGVVAAVTLPALITNYQKQVTINKIKKFYTNMTQVLQMAVTENGEFSTWNYSSSLDLYNKYIKPYIKNVEDVDTELHIHGDFTGGVRFVFTDGTQAILSSSTSWLSGNNKPTIIFYTNAQKHTDINSKYLKHPTRERFYFKINNVGMLVPPDMNNTREQNLQSCKYQWISGNNNNTNNGNVSCSTLIYKDGWKIDNDYPW